MTRLLRWPKLHPSSWVVLVASTSLAVLVNLPTAPAVSKRFSYSERFTQCLVGMEPFMRSVYVDEVECRMGWPIAYRVVKLPYEPEPAPSSGSVVRYESKWERATVLVRMRKAALLVNCTVWLLIVVPLTLTFEWRRRRRHRLWQFSARELLLGAAMLSACCAFVAVLRNRYHRQETVVAQSVMPGGMAEWEVRGRPWLLTLLRWLAGGSEPAWVFEVVKVTCVGNPAGFTDKDLFRVTRCRNIRMLYADSCSLSNASFRHLERCSRLEYLHIGCMTDNGTRHLVRLENLRTLVLVNASITDEGVRQLARLPRLRSLCLYSPQIRGVGLGALTSLGELESLHLSGTSIDDSALVHLGRLRRLRELYLNRTNVTDAGVQHLAHMRRLRVLGLFGTKVTPEGVEALSRRLPDVEIEL